MDRNKIIILLLSILVYEETLHAQTSDAFWPEISKEAKTLTKKSVKKLPINPTKETSTQQKTLNKFNSFLSSLNSIKKIPNVENATSNLSKQYPE